MIRRGNRKTNEDNRNEEPVTRTFGSSRLSEDKGDQPQQAPSQASNQQMQTGTQGQAKGKLLHFISGKGGAGGSIVSLNIACGIALLGFKVIIIDTDIGKNCIDLLLGVEGTVKGDIVRLLQSEIEPEQAFINYPEIPNLTILPAPSDRLPYDLNSKLIIPLFQVLKEQYNFIIVDTPTSIDYGFFTSLAKVDEVVVVTGPDFLSVRNTDRMIGILEDRGVPPEKLSFILNKYSHDLYLDGYIESDKAIKKIFKINHIGTIPASDEIFISECIKRPMVLNSDSKMGKLFLELSRVFIGEVSRVEFENSGGFFRKMLSIFKG